MRIHRTGRRAQRTVRQKVATAAMAIGVVLFGIAVAPGVASAHTFTHSFSCTGLSWSASLYDSAQTNSIVVTVDGGVVYSNPSFGGSNVGSHPWSQTVDHTFSIVVDAPGTANDRSVSNVQTACNPPTSSSTTTTTTTTTLPEVTTTTTEPEVTTTTAAGETTTTAAATTTTVEQAGPTTTASVGQGGPTSTVEQSSGAATTQAVGGSLPATGSDNSPSLIVIALTLIGVGAVMLRLTSRPTR